MFIAHDHDRRRDLLHGEFRCLALSGLEDITIAATTTAADLRPGRLQIRQWARIH